ncbi:YqiA/YcfP family alpha/beta fold hydrolase [Azonexus sp.]|uniref:YqiA/YcfP family alpha/beta fold hydrolase n=1 Tax=Azonexus sp. TaxID=1872668 RepID=UPI00282B9CBE|nr:YqiA/YcfP family alpha/beta fold hydrolase [Azonexus sp.]MDR1995758.1 alpha/beta fold hydrolase [Azonexus sp.]
MGGLILYLHGFRSSPGAWKARLLGEEMARRGLAGQFLCPPLSSVPDEVVAGLSQLIEGCRQPPTLVGSSLGGHYANYLAEKHDLRVVLINPAAIAYLDASQFVGEHVPFDGGPSFRFTPEHARQLEAQVVAPTPERYWLLLETGDEVLDYRQAQDFYFGCRQSVFEGGAHGFTRFPELLPQILEFAGI